jgi:hypothetical protein
MPACAAVRWRRSAASAASSCRNAVSMKSSSAPPASAMIFALRHRYDGADIVHVIIKQHDRIDWRRLLGYMDLHWEVLSARFTTTFAILAVAFIDERGRQGRRIDICR